MNGTGRAGAVVAVVALALTALASAVAPPGRGRPGRRSQCHRACQRIGLGESRRGLPAGRPRRAAGLEAVHHFQCERAFRIACYTPGQLRQAYDVWPLYERGSPARARRSSSSTLSARRRSGTTWLCSTPAYKLSPPPSFTIIQPAGAVPAYTGSSDQAGWAGETTLDVEYAHVMAPGASILLVETPTSENEGTTGFPQIVAAEEYVIEQPSR